MCCSLLFCAVLPCTVYFCTSAYSYQYIRLLGHLGQRVLIQNIDAVQNADISPEAYSGKVTFSLVT